jgi:hypothetical protein
MHKEKRNQSEKRAKKILHTIVFVLLGLTSPVSLLHHQTISLPFLPSPMTASYTNSRASPSPAPLLHFIHKQQQQQMSFFSIPAIGAPTVSPTTSSSTSIYTILTLDLPTTVAKYTSDLGTFSFSSSNPN